MKKSNIGLFIIIGFAAVIVIVAVIGLRMIIGSISSTANESVAEKEIDYDTQVKVPYDLRGFDEIEIDGAWTINIRQGEEYSVVIFCPEALKDRAFVEKRGDTLHFTDIFSLSRIRSGSIHADVIMPSLEKCEMNGAGSVYIAEFEDDFVYIEVNGAASIKNEKGVYETVSIEIKGASTVDFSGSETKNADIDIDGAGSITLAITGGFLDGSIDGLGSVKYYGEVSDNRIDIDGLGSVKKID